jgi:MoxR-like ATPase
MMSDLSIETLRTQLLDHNYICDPRLGTVLFLALKMQRPLYLEGEPGVGKTELAKTLAQVLGTKLIRLQCYEGLDIRDAAYDWNVGRQLIEIRLAEAMHETNRDGLLKSIYRREMLIERPLLQALSQPVAPVLLIDELDRADEAFEAFLLELLAEAQITIPELGTITAVQPPIVIITSNRTREVRDALKRRCLYHWLDFPDAVRELEIVRKRVPQAGETLAREVVAFVQRMRGIDLFKAPGIAETIDWTNALVALNVLSLEPDAVRDTLGVLLKYQDDLGKVMGGEAQAILDELRGKVL